MSLDIAHGGHGHGGHGHEEHLAHQFEDRAQQDDSYVVGMWTFLVTEIMFFGALFTAYIIYRYLNPVAFWDAHRHLNVPMGATNTVVLLTSSFFMALAVYNAQKSNKTWQLFWLGLTILCAFAFLVIKYFEYSEKFEHHLVPGANFHYTSVDAHERSVPAAGVADVVTEGKSNVSTKAAEMFFCLYFCMTGLHGIHVVIGILVLGTLFFMIKFNHRYTKYYMWVEMAGLYWHFVNVVWIFLFPLFYLIPAV